MSQHAEHAQIVAFLTALAERAAATVLDVYNAPFSVELKGPADPVTLADKRANELIVTALQKEFPGVPVVAEESPAEAYALFTLSDVTGVVEGRSGGARSSYNKIFWSELDVRLHQVALDLLGPDAELDGPWMKGFQFALSGPIYAGTNEIQRNIVAERVLGLPRK